MVRARPAAPFAGVMTMEINLEDALIEKIARLVETRIRKRPVTPTFLNIPQAAALLNVSPRTLRNWHQRGEGPKASYVGRLVRFTHDSVSEFIATRQSRRMAGVK
jgi:excisionase family DNA binding protein